MVTPGSGEGVSEKDPKEPRRHPYLTTFKLLICYLRDKRSIPPERLTLELIDVTTITAFLAWLRAERHNSPGLRLSS